MRTRPLLSICVPSRNRQFYFKDTILYLVKSLRTDVEFVFSDNSDDASIMIDFMKELDGDPRIVFLPSADRVLSMQDNWERTMEATSGDWICIVGDDDMVDPEAAELIRRTLALKPHTEAIAWSRPCYIWPKPGRRPLSVIVELGRDVTDVRRSTMWERYYLWGTTSAGIPQCPFSIYHAAISRDLMLRIRKRFGGRYFEYPAPDLEMTLKILTYAKHLVYSQRPYSVAGICPESNGSSFGDIKRIKEIQQNFARDLGRDMEKDDHFADFPFPSYLGNCIIIAQAQIWFKRKYNIEFSGWEENFVKACALGCEYLKTEEDYDIAIADYREGFARWRGGAYAHLFAPRPYAPPADVPKYTGVIHHTNVSLLYLDEEIGGARTLGTFYDHMLQIIPTIDELDFSNVGALDREERQKASA
ncbi:glycosyltransferase family 2 protein [Ensifer soli]|uniref:glycosyltransferase family 2 protein n=1 Tax=Ciceribacter sp. sgz301302 TaxID=3342379 RepID=UPI0035BB7C37